MNDLHFLTIAEAAKKIAARQLSPVELTQAYLQRINALEPQVNAFITLTADRALDQARVAEREIAAGHLRGPLHGIPFGLKDLYATAGILTTGHSRVCANHVPTEDAATVAKLYGAGALLVGKLSTCEFAHGAPAFDAPWPPARNPWNAAHFTGGSSSGSGAAVAAGFLPVAMGSDTGGSVRIPAAMCGTVGLKPTYGLVSRRGVTPNSFSFDHCGPLTWTVEDCAIVLNVIAGHDSRDPASARRPVPDYRAALTGDVRGLRIGVVRHFWEEDIKTDPEACAAMDAALDVMRGLGASVETVRMRPCQSYTDIKVVIAGTEIFAVHQRDLIARARDFGANFLVQTLAGCLFQSVDYVQAQRERRIVLQEMEGIYANYDVLVTTSSSPAPRLDHYSTLNAWVKPNVQAVFSVTGGPAIAICNGYTASGLPLSMQIAGRPFDEGTVLRMADAYEKATPWRKRRPQLVPGAPRPQISVPTALGKVEIDAQTRELAKVLAQRAGLTVDASMLESLCELAPYAFAMGSRIRRDHSWSEEPANVFTFPHY
jgi:aspartyl-tRNA(Asn)/glutamyl-tRNA(Gln) amidotransferase subunit A